MASPSWTSGGCSAPIVVSLHRVRPRVKSRNQAYSGLARFLETRASGKTITGRLLGLSPAQRVWSCVSSQPPLLFAAISPRRRSFKKFVSPPAGSALPLDTDFHLVLADTVRVRFALLAIGRFEMTQNYSLSFKPKSFLAILTRASCRSFQSAQKSLTSSLAIPRSQSSRTFSFSITSAMESRS